MNLFPEIKTTIQDVLRSDSQLKNADVELQQRAVEYLRLSTIASTDILVGINIFFFFMQYSALNRLNSAKPYLIAQKSQCSIKDYNVGAGSFSVLNSVVVIFNLELHSKLLLL